MATGYPSQRPSQGRQITTAQLLSAVTDPDTGADRDARNLSYGLDCLPLGRESAVRDAITAVARFLDRWITADDLVDALARALDRELPDGEIAVIRNTPRRRRNQP